MKVFYLFSHLFSRDRLSLYSSAWPGTYDAGRAGLALTEIAASGVLGLMASPPCRRASMLVSHSSLG